MSRCRSCGAPVIWATSENDRQMPLDKDLVTEGIRFRIGPDGRAHRVEQPDKPGHLSHFATCPNARAHRKPKAAKR